MNLYTQTGSLVYAENWETKKKSTLKLLCYENYKFYNMVFLGTVKYKSTDRINK